MPHDRLSEQLVETKSCSSAPSVLAHEQASSGVYSSHHALITYCRARTPKHRIQSGARVDTCCALPLCRRRLFPLLHKIVEMCTPWGVIVMAETAAEAAMTCHNNDTDPEGLNYAGEYVDEVPSSLFDGVADPGNGHLPGY